MSVDAEARRGSRPSRAAASAASRSVNSPRVDGKVGRCRVFLYIRGKIVARVGPRAPHGGFSAL